MLFYLLTVSITIDMNYINDLLLRAKKQSEYIDRCFC